ncbi:MAG: NADP-dependent oxidoreductase, partial [Gammaproteobacteria bacterium]|nr:NADP-dependent oxidoreductase [Gammaproteobacteria bacterium]
SKVLIHAGSGGVGTFAIQFAKAMGAYVATTGSKSSFELLRRLGADETIDYHSQAIEDVLSDYDIVLDTLGSQVHKSSYRVLKPGGVLVSILGIPEPQTVSEYTSNFIVKLVSKINLWKNQRLATKNGAVYKHHLMYADGGQLAKIAGLIDEKSIKAVIDFVFTLENIKKAFEISAKGRAKGKIIIRIESE